MFELKKVLQGRVRTTMVNGRTRKMTSIIGAINRTAEDSSWGVGAICPTETHIVFASCDTTDPELLWRALQIVDMFTFISDKAMVLALDIADSVIPLSSQFFEKSGSYLPYKCSVADIRRKVFSMEPRQSDLEAIVTGLHSLWCVADKSVKKVASSNNLICLPSTIREHAAKRHHVYQTPEFA